MSSSPRPPSGSSSPQPPTIFRCDFPEAAADDWAVFWEVEDEVGFERAEGNPADPTTVAGEWFAISPEVVVEVGSMR